MYYDHPYLNDAMMELSMQTDAKTCHVQTEPTREAYGEFPVQSTCIRSVFSSYCHLKGITLRAILRSLIQTNVFRIQKDSIWIFFRRHFSTTEYTLIRSTNTKHIFWR